MATDRRIIFFWFFHTKDQGKKMSGYGGLFGDVDVTIDAGTGDIKEGLDADASKGEQFNRMFGITRMVKRNADMLKMLDAPAVQMREVNAELQKLGGKGGTRLKGMYDELIGLGFSPEESKSRATILAGREMENDLGLLALKYPFSMGAQNSGGWDPIQTIMFKGTEGSKLQQFGRFAHAAMNTGMGVKGGIGKKHKGKKHYKKKFKKHKKSKKHRKGKKEKLA